MQVFSTSRWAKDRRCRMLGPYQTQAAAIYSLLGTAKLNGINPEHYLRYVLTYIADHPIQRIAELLPWNMTSSLTTEIKTDT